MSVHDHNHIELPGVRAQEHHRHIDGDIAPVDNKSSNLVLNDTSLTEGRFLHQADIPHPQAADEPAKVRSKLRTTAVMAAIYVSLHHGLLSCRRERFR